MACDVLGLTTRLGPDVLEPEEEPSSAGHRPTPHPVVRGRVATPQKGRVVCRRRPRPHGRRPDPVANPVVEKVAVDTFSRGAATRVRVGQAGREVCVPVVHAREVARSFVGRHGKAARLARPVDAAAFDATTGGDVKTNPVQRGRPYAPTVAL